MINRQFSSSTSTTDNMQAIICGLMLQNITFKYQLKFTAIREGSIRKHRLVVCPQTIYTATVYPVTHN